MKRLFTEVNYSLDVLLNQIKLGVIGLPDIQRPSSDLLFGQIRRCVTVLIICLCFKPRKILFRATGASMFWIQSCGDLVSHHRYSAKIFQVSNFGIRNLCLN